MVCGLTNDGVATPTILFKKGVNIHGVVLCPSTPFAAPAFLLYGLASRDDIPPKIVPM